MKDELVERRSLHRYALRLPIHIEHVGSGITRDVSANGVAFEIHGALATGSHIRFIVTFAEHALRLSCEGRVVRVDRTGDLTVAAATIDCVDHLIAEMPSTHTRRRTRQRTVLARIED